ncbi:MAG: TetR/AcrR family transcriptional regulator [Gemmatimonadota bacterium]
MPGERLPEPERREAILEGAYRVAVRNHLGGLSVQAVADAAGVSKGLVFHHFSDKETLLLALLDWLLARSPRVEVPGDLGGAEGVHPVRRLVMLVAYQVELLPERREQVELFLDFWVMGMAAPEIQERIRAAFDRYREGFVPYTAEVVRALPARFPDGDADGLAAVVVSFIEGCALQLMADPSQFDVDRYVRSVESLVLGD